MTNFELTDKEVELVRRALECYYSESYLDEQISEIKEVSPKFGLSFEADE